MGCARVLRARGCVVVTRQIASIRRASRSSSILDGRMISLWGFGSMEANDLDIYGDTLPPPRTWFDLHEIAFSLAKG